MLYSSGVFELRTKEIFSDANLWARTQWINTEGRLLTFSKIMLFQVSQTFQRHSIHNLKEGDIYLHKRSNL